MSDLGELIQIGKVTPGAGEASRLVLRVRQGDMPPVSATGPRMPDAMIERLVDFIDSLPTTRLPENTEQPERRCRSDGPQGKASAPAPHPKPAPAFLGPTSPATPRALLPAAPVPAPRLHRLPLKGSAPVVTELIRICRLCTPVAKTRSRNGS
jgi:hypothetical protein